MQYLELMQYVLDHGIKTGDRTGTGTRSIFGAEYRHLMSEGFPLLTTKKIHYKSVIGELLWFIRGSRDVRWLQRQGVRIWDEWRRPFVNMESERQVVSPAHMSIHGQHEYFAHGLFLPETEEWLEAVSASSLGDLPVGYEMDLPVCEDSSSQLKALYYLWWTMVDRCENRQSDLWPAYGGSDWVIDPVWRNFSAFERDVKSLPMWWYASRAIDDFVLMLNWTVGPNIRREYSPRHMLWVQREDAADYVRDGVKPTIYADGDMGPVYGVQWRSFSGDVDGEPVAADASIDQLLEVLETLFTDPTSRRMVVSAWNPLQLRHMALPPCHMMWQLKAYDTPQGDLLSMRVDMRSVDVFLGLPFNIASYATLLCLLATVSNRRPHELIIHMGDCHLYENHLEQAKTQLAREPRLLPRLVVPERLNLEAWVGKAVPGSSVLSRPNPYSLARYASNLLASLDCYELQVMGYEPHPHIPAPIAV